MKIEFDEAELKLMCIAKCKTAHALLPIENTGTWEARSTGSYRPVIEVTFTPKSELDAAAEFERQEQERKAEPVAVAPPPIPVPCGGAVHSPEDPF